MKKNDKIIWKDVILPKNEILHTRINQQLKEELKKEAIKENRTLSNLVEKIIKDYLKKGNEK